MVGRDLSARLVQTMSALNALAKQLGGDVCGRDILIPGPAHSRKDRSLAVRFHESGFTVYSHAGDDWQTCKDYVAALLGNEPTLAPREATIAPQTDNRGRALAIWADGQPWRGSLVEAYLARRGVSLPPECVDVRYMAACPMGRERVPAMVALVRSVATLEPLAIHRTHLSLDGTKGRLDRMMLGSLGDGIVMLSPDCDVTGVLGIGEGIETSLSLRECPEYGAGPVWACLSAGRLATFAPLGGTKSLFIAVDNDPAGQKAAHQCAKFWTQSGSCVALIAPKVVKHDLNDCVLKRGAQ
jgi:putative DNA primase/helicase